MPSDTWKAVPLRELCSMVQYGYTASASEDPIGPKFLRITDIVPQTISWDAVPYCDMDSKKQEKYALRQGDIVIARTGATTGYAKHIRKAPNSVFASYLVRIRVKPTLDARYVGLVIESDRYKVFIQTHAGGAAQPNANAQVLTSFPVPLPPLPTQRKIAYILSAYDDLIENNLRRIKILEEMVRLIYQEWFVKFRFPGHEKVCMTDSELGKIPEAWEIREVGDCCTLVMGQSPKSEFYNTEGEGLPFHQGVTDFGDRFPSTRVFCTVRNRTAEQGDILFSVRAPVGRINIANQRIVVGRGLSAIRAKDGHQSFLFHQLKHLFQHEDTMGGGTIFKAVTKRDMVTVQLIKPVLSFVEAFEKVSVPLDDEIAVLSEQIRNLRQTRDLLLPKLISGEIDVSDLDIKTSEVESCPA